MLTELDTAWPDSADLLADGALHALQTWELVVIRIAGRVFRREAVVRLGRLLVDQCIAGALQVVPEFV